MNNGYKYPTVEEAAEANRLKTKEYFNNHRAEKQEYDRIYYQKNRDKKIQQAKEWKQKKKFEDSYRSQLLQQFLASSKCPCQQHLVLDNPFCNVLQYYLSQPQPTYIQIEIVDTQPNINHSKCDYPITNEITVHPKSFFI